MFEKLQLKTAIKTTTGLLLVFSGSFLALLKKMQGRNFVPSFKALENKLCTFEEYTPEFSKCIFYSQLLAWFVDHYDTRSQSLCYERRVTCFGMKGSASTEALNDSSPPITHYPLVDVCFFVSSEDPRYQDDQSRDTTLAILICKKNQEIQARCNILPQTSFRYKVFIPNETFIINMFAKKIKLRIQKLLHINGLFGPSFGYVG